MPLQNARRTSPYAFFILATTESLKVPATIVSRCQRFAFKRIGDEDLGYVFSPSHRQKGGPDPEAMRLIISRADGCVRDAETLLGQVDRLEKRISRQPSRPLLFRPATFLWQRDC